MSFRNVVTVSVALHSGKHEHCDEKLFDVFNERHASPLVLYLHLLRVVGPVQCTELHRIQLEDLLQMEH
jgi:hypothetical protein